MGLGLLDLSRASSATPYPWLGLAVAVMGAGMGLVMAPASTTIMATVPAHQAGAGSAVNDTIREVGGALGVAIVGSVTAALYGNHLTRVLVAHHAPPAALHVATTSIAAADIVGTRIGGATGDALVAAAHSAFVSAMDSGIQVAAAVALLGAIGCFAALPRRIVPPAPAPARTEVRTLSATAA